MVLGVLDVVLGVVPGGIQGFLRKSPNASLEAFGLGVVQSDLEFNVLEVVQSDLGLTATNS